MDTTQTCDDLATENDRLALALQEERGKRAQWSRRYYELLFACEEAFATCGVKLSEWNAAAIGKAIKELKPVRMDAVASKDARPALSNDSPDNSRVAAAETFGVSRRTAHSAASHTSHSIHTLEAYGQLPDWAVANAVCDAPSLTVDLASADESNQPPDGGVEGKFPSPLASTSNGPHRNIRGPLSLPQLNSLTEIDLLTEAAL